VTYHDFTYEAVLGSSLRAQWELDDVLRADQELDFTRNFLPESLARTGEIDSLDADEQRILNQITAHQYICMFETVEAFVIPFLMDHARAALGGDPWRLRALTNFADEEAKHIHLFRRFHQAFVRGFRPQVQLLGPSRKIGARVLGHDPLAVGLVILLFEWMTHQHYLGSVRDSGDIDPLFKNMLKYHWMEEAQHAKLDTLIVDELANVRSENQRLRSATEFFQLLQLLDEGFGRWARFNIVAFETVIGRKLHDREAIIAQQHWASRWAYIRCGLVHERVQATLRTVSPIVAARAAQTVRVIEQACGTAAVSA
jgi:hypothetical protein